MPIYEFRCRTCGNVSEFLVGVTTESAFPRCKNCGSDEMERLLSAAAVTTHQRKAGRTCCGRVDRSPGGGHGWRLHSKSIEGQDEYNP